MLSARDGSKAKGDEADTWGGARSKTGPDSAIKAGHNAGVGVSTSTPAVGAEETSNSLSHAEAASRSVPNKLVPHQLEQHLQSLDFSPGIFSYTDKVLLRVVILSMTRTIARHLPLV